MCRRLLRQKWMKLLLTAELKKPSRMFSSPLITASSRLCLTSLLFSSSFFGFHVCHDFFNLISAGINISAWYERYRPVPAKIWAVCYCSCNCTGFTPKRGVPAGMVRD
uniref:Uncharacterized protein n=1 Tax=Opuntia streptacantha TaxID=393608 RepID=A0A7C8YG88_OPUST